MKIRFFELARRLSKHSDHYQHKLGCVIVRKNKILSVGFNKLSTHPKSPHAYHSLHAEISALIGLSYEDLRYCVAYVYRETKDGKTALARPCPSCERALKLAGIRGVYYTTNTELGWEFLKF